jgi:hypothetical protein
MGRSSSKQAAAVTKQAAAVTKEEAAAVEAHERLTGIAGLL